MAILCQAQIVGAFLTDDSSLARNTANLAPPATVMGLLPAQTPLGSQKPQHHTRRHP